MLQCCKPPSFARTETQCNAAAAQGTCTKSAAGKQCQWALKAVYVCAVYQLWAWNNIGLNIDVNHIIMNAEQTELMVNSLEHCRCHEFCNHPSPHATGTCAPRSDGRCCTFQAPCGSPVRGSSHELAVHSNYIPPYIRCACRIWWQPPLAIFGLDVFLHTLFKLKDTPEVRSVLATNDLTACAMSSCLHNLVNLACHIGGMWSRRLMQHRHPADSIEP